MRGIVLIGLSRGVCCSSFCGCCWRWGLFSEARFLKGFELGFLVLGRGGIFAGAQGVGVGGVLRGGGLVPVCIFNPNSDD